METRVKGQNRRGNGGGGADYTREFAGHVLFRKTREYSEAGESRSSSPPSSHLMQIRSSSSCAKRTLVTVPGCPR